MVNPPNCKCGCSNFEQNLFKPSSCRNCLHVHTQFNIDSLQNGSKTINPPDIKIETIPTKQPKPICEKIIKPIGYHRAKIVSEIYESEKSFIYQLGLLTQYKKYIKESNTISSDIQDKIFYGIEPILGLHKSFLIQLKEQVSSGAPYDTIHLGDIFCKICPFLKAHISYATQHDEGEKAIMKLTKTNRKFVSLLNNFPVSAYSGVFGFTSLRIAPIQRIPRYNLLLEDLLKHTPLNSEEYNNLKIAYDNCKALGIQMDKGLHTYQGSVLIHKLDSNMSGNRQELISSGSHSIDLHHKWNEKKRMARPSICIWCKLLIIPGKRFQSCEKCGANVHSRGCIHNVSPLCKEPSLIEQGRIFLNEFNNVGYQNPSKSKKFKNATLVLFNESLFLYYGNTNDAKIIAMIRWKSATTGQKIIIVDSSENIISIKSPRTSELHYLKTNTKEEKELIYNSINRAIDNWNDLQASIYSRTKSILNDKDFIIISYDKIDPRVQFRISSIQEVYIQDDIYNGYLVEVNEPNGTTVILKRYEEFVILHTNLRNCYGSRKLPKLPAKHRLKDTRNKVLYNQSRCRGLEQYLNGIIEVKGLINLPIFNDFVRTSLINTNEPNPESTWKDDDISDDSWSDISDDEENDEEYIISNGIYNDDNDDNDDNGLLLSDGSSTTSSYSNLSSYHMVSVGQMLYDFSTKELKQSLDVLMGDIIDILNEDNKDWWFCRNRSGETGFVPSSYVSKFSSVRTIDNFQL